MANFDLLKEEYFEEKEMDVKEIKESLREMCMMIDDSMQHNGVPSVHCIQKSIGWSVILVNDDGGFQDLTEGIAEIFNLNYEEENEVIKDDDPGEILPILSVLMGFSFYVDWGENGGGWQYCGQLASKYEMWR